MCNKRFHPFPHAPREVHSRTQTTSKNVRFHHERVPRFQGCGQGPQGTLVVKLIKPEAHGKKADRFFCLSAIRSIRKCWLKTGALTNRGDRCDETELDADGCDSYGAHARQRLGRKICTRGVSVERQNTSEREHAPIALPSQNHVSVFYHHNATGKQDKTFR